MEGWPEGLAPWLWRKSLVLFVTPVPNCERALPIVEPTIERNCAKAAQNWLVIPGNFVSSRARAATVKGTPVQGVE